MLLIRNDMSKKPRVQAANNHQCVVLSITEVIVQGGQLYIHKTKICCTIQVIQIDVVSNLHSAEHFVIIH